MGNQVVVLFAKRWGQDLLSSARPGAVPAVRDVYAVGDRVLAKYPAWDTAYAGTVSCVHASDDGRDTFYDVDFEETRGWKRNQNATGPKLVARVLLPQEDLGMRYLPELESAVLISATTWIKGSFEASSRYLGLTRAAEPREDEEREPRPHETLFVPEIFDYSRVLIAVPRDAPAVSG